MNKLLVILAVLYVLMPFDLLPDFIPVRGWIDDIIVVAWLVYRYLQFQQRKTYGEKQTDQQSGTGDHANQFQDLPPHKILEVAPDASVEQIKNAYRKLAAKYHPDKFAHLDEDFHQLAEERFKQIQAAYQAMISKARKENIHR